MNQRFRFIPLYDIVRLCYNKYSSPSDPVSTWNSAYVSKKIENHCYAIGLHFVYYNFVEIHKTLRAPPAIKTGLIKRLISIEEIVKLVEA